MHVGQIDLPLGHPGPGDAVLQVEFGLPDLLRDAETALHGLFGTDRPVVVLIEREGDVERAAQVERPGQRARRLGPFGEGNAGDRHPGDVGGLLQLQRSRVGHGVDVPDRAGETLALDAEDFERHHRVGDVVADAAGGQHQGAKPQQEGNMACFHGHFFFLSHR